MWRYSVSLGKLILSWAAWLCRRHYDMPENVKTSTTICPAQHNSAIDLQLQHFSHFFFLYHEHCLFSFNFPVLSMPIIFVYEDRRCVIFYSLWSILRGCGSTGYVFMPYSRGCHNSSHSCHCRKWDLKSQWHLLSESDTMNLTIFFLKAVILMVLNYISGTLFRKSI